MLDKVLSFIAPHYCCGCGVTGSLLCDNCKKDIDNENLMCIGCRQPTNNGSMCKSCRMPYERAWIVGEREGVLQRVIGLYKFSRAKSGYKILGDLLLTALPELPVGTIIVPIPTVSSHVRERGYDHMLLIAKYVAKKRKLKIEKLLYRRTNTKQRQSSAKQRIYQAKRAFGVYYELDDKTSYLLIDDVITTGATIKYASLALRNAGAKHVWVAIIARQTLD